MLYFGDQYDTVIKNLEIIPHMIDINPRLRQWVTD